MPTKDTKSWNGVLDEAKWGTPDPQQVVIRNWDWKVSETQWGEAVKQKGEGRREEVRFDLWLPKDLQTARGVVVMSGHGSGEALFKRADLRKLGQERRLALFKFTGNPMQRGFWPQSLLFEQLRQFGEKSGHPELEHTPFFLYGHSNGTGFSAIFTSYVPDRVWGWVSMRPGITFQVYQPGAAQVPGLVIFGEDDPFLARHSKEENLAVVPALRKNHHVLWNIAVEPKTGHGPVKLQPLTVESGHLGQNWQTKPGGYQKLIAAPFVDFSGDKSTASWLLNEAYAADWQRHQRGIHR